MKPDVLEHNVRRLLRRSYVPALPAPHFRDRLESLVLAAVTGRARRKERRSVAPRWVLAVAAAALALFLGWRALAVEGPPSRERLLARGAIALGRPDGSWRAADEEERRHGIRFAPPSLVAVTPVGVTLEILASGGRVHLEASSEVRLASPADAPDQISATLRAGTGWFVRNDQRHDLERGVPHSLLEAPSEPGAIAASPLTGPTREPRPASPALVKAPGTPTRVLAGRLVLAQEDTLTDENTAAGALPNEFTVALLRERVGNQTYPPVLRTFTGEGTFQWPDPPSGKQRVFVHAPGFALCALGEFDLSASDLSALPELKAELTRGVGLLGSVLDAAGNPVADALVLSQNDVPSDGLFLEHSEHAFWLPIQARTGPDGRFELANLRPGTHTLRATAPGLAPAWSDGVRVPRERGEEPTLTLGAGGTVEGFVTRADGGPWAKAEIVIVTMDHVERAIMNFALTRTDADGRYRFEHLPPMTMIVVMLRADNRPDVRPVQVIEGETLTADFGEPRQGIRLHGRLLRAGAPIPNQNIGLFDRSTSSWNQDWVATTTQNDGAYLFEGALPGRYLIFLIDEMGRGLRCVDELELGQGELDVEHDVRVQGGTCEVRVREAAGRAPAGPTALILMRIERKGTEFSAFGMTESERYTFTDLRPGSYSVIAYPSRPDLGFEQGEPFSIAAGEQVSRELLLGPGGVVTVRVRSSAEQALENATVVFHDQDGNEHLFSRTPLTDGAGHYRASGLRPGQYQVQAQLEGYRGEPVRFTFELGHELEIPVVLTPLDTPLDTPSTPRSLGADPRRPSR